MPHIGSMRLPPGTSNSASTLSSRTQNVAVTVFKQWHAKHLDLPHSMNPVVIHKLITTEEADEFMASS